MSVQIKFKFVGLAGFIVMADNWAGSPILPAISQNLNIDIAKAGLLITAYMIPFGFFQTVFGPLADRFGKKQVITFTTAMPTSLALIVDVPEQTVPDL